ncbi:MAG: AAA domain-containing protein, partial [Bacteroidia bacterium]
MSSARESLQRLVDLLSLEKTEDHKQYLEQFERHSIAARRKNGVTWYPVVISSEEIGPSDNLIIEIERTQGQNELHQFSNGKVIEIFSNSGDKESEFWKINGTVRNAIGNKMRIALNVDELPGWADRGKLGINLLFDENSYREMLIAIQKTMDAERSRLAELRDIIYGDKQAVFEKRDENIMVHSLNRSQNEALRNVVAAQDVAIIHGPPGTGKTTTLVQAIRLTLMKEKQVLVC